MADRPKDQLVGRELPAELYGWWRITETSQWVSDGMDDLGIAMISITGQDDRLRLHCLLARVQLMPTKTGASFTWPGAWESDPMRGTGRLRLGRDGRIHGRIAIEDGDQSTFIAEQTTAPPVPIQDPPSYRDKWRWNRRP